MNKKYISLLKPFYILAFIFIALYSCRREEDKASWETNIITPLLKSSLNIKQIIADSLLKTDADNSVKVVYENHLYTMSVDSLFNLYDTSVTKVYKLDSISLYDESISYPVTLGQICLNSGLVGALIISQNGNMIAVPAIPSISSSPFIINADTLFQSMTLISGYIDITLYNGLPIDITNLSFELKNTNNGLIIASDTFPPITAGASQTKTVSLAGKTVEGNMTAQILSMSSPGSNGVPVLIDTTNTLLATLKVYDLHPSTATAIFPQQNLINKAQPFVFKFDSVQLKEAKIKSGSLALDLYSTLQDTVHFHYSLPNASNGTPFDIVQILPPAPSNGVSSYHHVYNLSGYDLDMRGNVINNQDTINTMYNTFTATVDSTGIMRTLSLTDSIYANLGFQSLKPSYVRGYLGQQTVDMGPSQLPIDIFKNITGALQLENVNMSIAVKNGIGADAKVDNIHITSVNSRSGNTVNLSGTALANPINIVRATDNNGNPPVTETYTTFLLNNSNSNASSFLSNLPDKLNYSLSLQTDPGGFQASQYHDFIYYDKLMEFNLDVEMPLSFIANNLTLSDTVNFSLNAVDISRIKDGTLTLIADNGFPFDANVQIYTLDNVNHITDSLLSYTLISAASVNPINNIVTEKKRSKLTIPVNEQKIQTLFNTKRMKIVAGFTTKPVNTNVKIYSDYSIDFQLTGDFNYRAN
jgi:hypothetical protein